MPINNVNRSTNVTAALAYSAPTSGGLSAEAQILTLRNSLQSLDSQIQSITDGVQSKAAAAKEIADEIALKREAKKILDRVTDGGDEHYEIHMDNVKQSHINGVPNDDFHPDEDITPEELEILIESGAYELGEPTTERVNPHDRHAVGHLQLQGFRPSSKDPSVMVRDAYVSKTETTANSLQDDITQLEAEVKQLNSGNDLLMIQMQNLTQQRSQMISMTTNIIRGMTDSSRGVVANLK